MKFDLIGAPLDDQAAAIPDLERIPVPTLVRPVAPISDFRALASLRADHANLVIASRRIVERHPDVGPLWSMCARLLTSDDPTELAWQVPGASVGATSWPAPLAFRDPSTGLESYGYEDRVLLWTDVEPLELGDPMRFLGSSKGGISALFANCNRGKRSVVIDLDHPAGVEIVNTDDADTPPNVNLGFDAAAAAGNTFTMTFDNLGAIADGQQAISDLQQQLVKDDQSIPEIRNQDPDDLALQATATADDSLKLPRRTISAVSWHRTTQVIEIERDGLEPIRLPCAESESSEEIGRGLQKALAPAHHPESVPVTRAEMVRFEMTKGKGRVPLLVAALSARVIGEPLAGMEVDFPFLDDDLVAFSALLPPQEKLRGTRLRHLFKEALRGFLPDEILTKQKQGFGLPFGLWLVEHPGLRDFTHDTLAGLKRRDLVRPEFIDELLGHRHAQHAAYYGDMVWVLVMLEQWLSVRDKS